MLRRIGFRIDRYGQVFERHLGGNEKKMTPEELRKKLVDNPEITLMLDNVG